MVWRKFRASWATQFISRWPKPGLSNVWGSSKADLLKMCRIRSFDSSDGVQRAASASTALCYFNSLEIHIERMAPPFSQANSESKSKAQLFPSSKFYQFFSTLRALLLLFVWTLLYTALHNHGSLFGLVSVGSGSEYGTLSNLLFPRRFRRTERTNSLQWNPRQHSCRFSVLWWRRFMYRERFMFRTGWLHVSRIVHRSELEFGELSKDLPER